MFLAFLTESFQSYSLVSVLLAVFVVLFLFVLRPDGVNKEQTQVSAGEGNIYFASTEVWTSPKRRGEITSSRLF